MALTADKWAVRDYVTRTIGAQYLKKPYLHTADVGDISLSNLPRSFVVKPTHASGYVRLVEDKALESEAELRDLCSRWMGLDYYRTSREWVYSAIPKAILVEENLCRNGRPPADFKFYIANGSCFLVQVDTDRFTEHRETHYDRDFVALPFTSDGYPLAEEMARPRNFSLMRDLAEQLAQPFIFARVDLFSVEDSVFFGEITHFPASGKSIYTPRSAGEDILARLNAALRSSRKVSTRRPETAGS